MILRNKVVIVTGASGGIGQAIANLFGVQGCKVVIAYRSDKVGAQKTAKIIEKNGGQALIFQGELSDESVVERLFNLVIDKFRTIDILINNAGKALPRSFIDTDYSYWLEHFNNNLFNMVLCSRAAFSIMKAGNGGKIINMASINGLDYAGRPDTEAYSSAKAAVINFTKTLANAGAPNVLVNAVAPGKTRTPYYDQFDERYREELTSTTPIKRFVSVDEIAETFLFIAKNDGMTGEVIVVDGGFSLKRY